MDFKLNKKFGDSIRNKREKLGLGLRQLAKKTSISPSYLSRIERGELAPPSENKIIELAEILNYNLDELFSIAGKITPDIREIIIEDHEQTSKLIRNIRS